MSKVKFFIFCGLFFLSVGMLKVSAQQVFKTTAASVIAYLEYVPQDYNTNSDKYPIVFFLHGVGERGPNSTDLATLQGSIDLVTRHGPPQYVKAGTQFPFILISPQLKSNNAQWTTAYIMEVINYCKTYLRIDERRIYLTGLSLGGGGTWVAAQDQPELFAAIGPVCGGYNSTSMACGIAHENLPVWAFHGDKDTTVPLARSQNMVNAINNCVPTPSPLAKLTIYAGVAHNAWDYAYKTDNSLHNPNFYQWITSFTNVYNAGNTIPIAKAGPDKTLSLAGGTISGSGADSDGSIASFAWTKISGPAATLANITSSTLSLANLAVGNYVFRLQVTDNNGNTDSDYVTVNAIVNTAPVSNAGVDKTITLPANTTMLSGSGTDADGTIASYQWTKISGGSVTLMNATSATLNLSALLQGTYSFRLSVTDNLGASDSDDVTVQVNAPVAPIVNAGADRQINLPTTSATITGSATDIGGTIASYQWTKISGGSCTMNNTTTSALKIGALASGSYTFRLTATDNNGNPASDDMKLTVDAPPAVNAGPDKTIVLPFGGSLILTGTATDSDGTIVKYQWSKYSGPNLTAEDSGSASFKITKMYEGVYVFKFAVTDNLGAQGIDYVTVTVNPEIVNHAPVSNAGPDKNITLPTNSMTLAGAGTDTDGSIVSFQWTKVSGGSVTMANMTSATLNLTGLLQGTYVFRLTVTDNDGAINSDDVIVVVNPPVIPVVNAGNDKLVPLPTTTAALTGSATDNDGTIVSYQWTKISGANCTMTNSTTSMLKLGSLTSGNYTFRLTATDNDGYTASDDMILTVDAPPLVNAGADISITLPLGTSLILNGTATDSDGTIVKYLWSKHSGPNVTAGSATNPSFTITQLFEGVYVFKLAVTDNLGVQGIDYVTVTVGATVTSSSRMQTDETQILTESELTKEHEGFNDDAVLGKRTMQDLEGCIVFIFDDSGKRLYAGAWSVEKDHEILQQGLYIYNVMKKGVRVDSGKIFKQGI
jgi:dienelactone hydrolase